MVEAQPEKMTPERKAAAVIVSLGVDKASQIYKYLGQEDLERLTVEVAKLGHVKAEETEGILDEVNQSKCENHLLFLLKEHYGTGSWVSPL